MLGLSGSYDNAVIYRFPIYRFVQKEKEILCVAISKLSAILGKRHSSILDH